MTASKRNAWNGILTATVFAAASAVVIQTFRFPREMAEQVKSSFVSCAVNVLPTLFPFMVISSIIVKTGLVRPAEKILEKPFGFLFRLPAASVTPYILGLLCSFPVGASSTADAYGNGLLTKDEAERTAALSNNTGPGFAVVLAGTTWAGNVRTGILIYAAEIMSSVLTGVLLLRKKDRGRQAEKPVSNGRKTSVGRAVAESVPGAVTSCGAVAGNVVFFSLLLRALSLTFGFGGERPLTVLSVILEFSDGVKNALAIRGPVGVALAAFAVCSGSVSVLCQAEAVLSTRGLSAAKSAVFKTVQGATGALICFVTSSLFPSFLPVGEGTVRTVKNAGTAQTNPYMPIFCAASVAAAAVFSVFHMLKRRRKSLKI